VTGPITCRCDEPDADPYECEADDCTHEFSELNPFGRGRPVNTPSAEVSRACKTCGWTTSVWHVDDGSADEELHRHVARDHALEALAPRAVPDPDAPGPWGDPIAYGPTGVRCGCGKDAHSNLTPCQPDAGSAL
jgi:hypothetical protein